MVKSLKIGILGTRGIPNRYGGFEECAEKLALGLVQRGHEVWVYNSTHHEYQEAEWNGVHIIHCKDPEPKIGTIGQFIYDWYCFRDARERDYDILLQLGYTSSSVWYWRWPKQCKNLVNMDGLEWKRSKYSKKVQLFLKQAERLAAKYADGLIADSLGIQEYLQEKYSKPSVFIPYGADLFDTPQEAILAPFQLAAEGYHLLIARLEPENNIEMILQGFLQSGTTLPLLIIGSTGTAFGAYLEVAYGHHANVRFLGAIYDAAVINNLRCYSLLYYHGHSVGGTNPSLLEAMGCRALIVAHDNVFNKAVLGEDAFYFSGKEDVARIINQVADKKAHAHLLDHNQQKIRDQYNWPAVVEAYERVMLDAVEA